MSNTYEVYKREIEEGKWELTRRVSKSKQRAIIPVTGKTYSEAYVVENDLLDDFVLTRDKICSILQLSDQVVDTYVMPSLDIAYAGDRIKTHIDRMKIQVVISKNSFMNFIGNYIDTVQEKQEIYLVRKTAYDYIPAKGTEEDSDEFTIAEKLVNSITINIYERFKNHKYIQQFLDFATNYLETHVFKDYKTNLLEDKEKAVSIVKNAIEQDILNGLQSYRSIAIEQKFKHTMQARRYVESSTHYTIKVKSLEPASGNKKDVVRFVMYPTVYTSESNTIEINDKSDVDTKEYYSLTAKSKTIEYLKSLNTDYDMAAIILKSILDNYEVIFASYNQYLEHRKGKNRA